MAIHAYAGIYLLLVRHPLAFSEAYLIVRKHYEAKMDLDKESKELLISLYGIDYYQGSTPWIHAQSSRSGVNTQRLGKQSSNVRNASALIPYSR